VTFAFLRAAPFWAAEKKWMEAFVQTPSIPGAGKMAPFLTEYPGLQLRFWQEVRCQFPEWRMGQVRYASSLFQVGMFDQVWTVLQSLPLKQEPAARRLLLDMSGVMGYAILAEKLFVSLYPDGTWIGIHTLIPSKVPQISPKVLQLFQMAYPEARWLRELEPILGEGTRKVEGSLERGDFQVESFFI